MQKITADSPEAKSADIFAENIARLKALFPEAFAEDGIDFEVLKQLLGGAVNEKEEKCSFTWPGKRQARQIALAPSLGTLRPAPEESVNWDTTQNLFIEGDNLEVLKLLQKSYSGKVKMIYIDPPYNTGKDFVYKDDYRDNIKNYLKLTQQTNGEGSKITSNPETSGRYHSNWLNMLFPRLRLARNLLRDDGIICVSIDDAEIDNLLKIFAEIFGLENFVANITWEKGRKNDAKLFSSGHEYVVVYAKSLAHIREIGTVWREEKPGAREIWEKYSELRTRYGHDDRHIEEALRAWYSELPKTHPSKKWSRYKRIDAHGPWRDRDISWPGGGGPRYEVVHPVTKTPCAIPEAGWRFSTPEEMQRQIKLGLVEFRTDHTEPPFRKAHIRPIPDELGSVDVEETEESQEEPTEEFANQVRSTYFYKQSQVAVKELRSLMGAKVFNNPKDCDELARLFDYCTSSDPTALVVDFFAGSGTSGDAVWRLNSRDNGQRRWVLVQLPEPLDSTKKEQKASAKFCATIEKPLTIAELTKERLRRAAAKTNSEKPQFLGDLGFRVFKLDSSNIRPWNPDANDVAGSLLAYTDNLLPDRTEQDLLYEVLLKFGLDLTSPMQERAFAGHTIYSMGQGVLFACLSKAIAPADIEPIGLGIADWRKEANPVGESTIIFRDSAFTGDVAKANMTAILQQHGIDNVRSL